jgi:hypothetical protein
VIKIITRLIEVLDLYLSSFNQISGTDLKLIHYRFLVHYCYTLLTYHLTIEYYTLICVSDSVIK